VDSNTIAMLELTAGDDESKLGTSIEATNQCGSKSTSQFFALDQIKKNCVAEGVDACDTAAMMYDCLKDKVMDVVIDVLNKAEHSQAGVSKIWDLLAT